jgi:uncharacterized membrane protein
MQRKKIVTIAHLSILGWGAGGWLGYGSFDWPWPGLIWLAVALLFWAGLIALLVWAVRSVTGPRHQPDMTRERALDVLRRRLANGEITPEEFGRIQELLRD